MLYSTILVRVPLRSMVEAEAKRLRDKMRKKLEEAQPSSLASIDSGTDACNVMYDFWKQATNLALFRDCNMIRSWCDLLCWKLLKSRLFAVAVMPIYARLSKLWSPFGSLKCCTRCHTIYILGTQKVTTILDNHNR